MEIILHIGTHKTGTSSLQTYLATNKKVLREHGIYYALDSRNFSGRNVNFLPAHIAYGRHEEATEFIHDVLADAKENNAKKILFSSESFFAMTSFFNMLDGESIEDYEQTESAHIKFLHSLLAKHHCKIICYVRDQDEFLESIYNQIVKQAEGFSDSIENFISNFKNMARYDIHLKLWQSIFAGSDLIVHKYAASEHFNIIDDFMPLIISDYVNTEFQPVEASVNVRLDPQLLTFKKYLNRMKFEPVEDYINYRITTKLARQRRNLAKDKSVLSADLQDIIKSEYVNCNEYLAKNFQNENNPPDLQAVSTSSTKTYSPEFLDSDSAFEIYQAYSNIRFKAITIAEIVARKFYRKIITIMPASKSLFGYPRLIINFIRVKKERQGKY